KPPWTAGGRWRPGRTRVAVNAWASGWAFPASRRRRGRWRRFGCATSPPWAACRRSASVTTAGPGRWGLALNAEPAERHSAHPHRDEADHTGWVGVDRGLSAFLVAAKADGAETARIHDAPRALSAGMRQQRHLAKKLSRKKKGSVNRRQAAAKLARHHYHIAN